MGDCKMDIQTKTQGIVNVTDEQRLEFVSGLLGFEDEKEFALIPSEYEPFFWMQSLSTVSLAFLVVDPFFIRTDYEVDIDDKNLEAIGIKDASDISVLAIVTVPGIAGQAITVNLQGPIIINKKNGMCFQAVLHDTPWTTKHALISELKKEDSSC
jgi:flagellar assembly factor FliW